MIFVDEVKSTVLERARLTAQVPITIKRVILLPRTITSKLYIFSNYFLNISFFSWGPNWAENGFAKAARRNVCGILDWGFYLSKSFNASSIQ